MKTILTVLAAGLVLAGCDCKCTKPGEVRRAAALEDSAWAASEWISAANAPVADRKEAFERTHRAADGTDCFWRRQANAKKVIRATWMTSGLGVYELYVNGKRIDLDPLKPGFTDWKKTKYSFTYDVTAAIRTGAGEANDFGAEVSSGWWRDQCMGFVADRSAFRSVLKLEYADGTSELVGTRPDSWAATSAGPVTHAGIFDGEEYDARLTNFARTPAADFVPGGCLTNGVFQGQILPTIGAEIVHRDDLAMVRGPYVLKAGETVVIDFGQNCAGVPHFVFSAKAGTVLTALFGEMVNDADKGQRGCDGPKGSLYRANLRIPDCGMRASYTFAGTGVETYRPRFTFFGYRYMSVTATDAVEIKSVASVPVTSIAAEMEIGRIETGVKEVNRLIANVYWGQLSNYLSVPTDCPQRDERQGWSADTQVFTEAGSFNANTAQFLRKWMHDMRDTQSDTGAFPGVAPAGQYGPAGYMRLGWQDAGIIVPYQVWKQFGDRSIVDENWEAMDRFLDHLTETKMDMEVILKECGGYQYADWVSFENFEPCSGRGCWNKGLAADAKNYFSYLGACYWMWDAQMMGVMARGTGRDAAKYDRLAAEAKAYLKEKFFKTPDGLICNPFRDMQTPALFALKLGLVEGAAKERTLAALLANFKAHGDCLQTGFLGTSILMDTLTENGCADVAYTLLLQRKCPSWLYSVDQGATTIWERWNSYTVKDGFGPVGMNSFNHYAYGSVLAWIYKTAAGIAADPSAPGFKTIVMAPKPDRRLGFVKAEYKSSAGLIKSAWRYEGDKWIWDFTVPAGAMARVTLPGALEAANYGAGDHHVEVVAK